MTRAATIIHGIGTLVSPAPVSAPLRGADLAATVQIAGAAIAIDERGYIIAAGRESDVRASTEVDGDTWFHHARGALAVPGFVDCHAHLVFAGDRAHEFELRNIGSSYEQIHASGGGIRSTVSATRVALQDGTIAPLIRQHLDWLVAAGTTTSEGKSGYALTRDGEVASLTALHDVAADHPLRVVGTLLAAHTIPAEYEGRGDAYIDDVAIPTVRDVCRDEHRRIAQAADIFLERGSFTAEQARRYLQIAREVGLAARLHGDQFTDQGGIPVAIEIGARSIDHLEALEATAPRLRDLARSDVAAVLLPLSSLFLNRPYAPGRDLVDAGAIVAIASDFNPGSSYGESLPLAMSLACLGAGLRAAEVLNACTINAAWVLGLQHEIGRIEPGYRGDVVLLDQPSIEHLPYHIGSPGIVGVFIDGREVVGSGRVMM